MPEFAPPMPITAANDVSAFGCGKAPLDEFLSLHAAYSFAKDKPLVLLDGGKLLHLLMKHGRKVRIDLAEAKALGKG